MINLDSKETKKNDFEKAGKIIGAAKAVTGAAAATAAIVGVAVKALPKLKSLIKK